MSYRILIVCSGNTCRSPMAKAMLEDAIAKTGLEVEVDSAGTSGIQAGEPMDRRAIAALGEFGISPGAHCARHVTIADLAGADLVITMTAAHFGALHGLAPDGATMTNFQLLRSFDPDCAASNPIDGSIDVADPYSGTQDDYRNCVRQIKAALPGILQYVASELGQAH